MGETDQMSPSSAAAEQIVHDREAQGRAAFATMLRAWMNRSGWSLQVLSDLCELAMRQAVAPGVSDWAPGRYRKGDLVVANGSVWRADAPFESHEAPQRSAETNAGFTRVSVLRRLHPSQLNILERNTARQVNTVVFDTLGTLNLFLTELRSGKRLLPGDPRLLEKARQATIIEDADGPYGPEEFFSVFVGRLDPPFSAMVMTPEQASEESRRLARRIRQGMVEAGLDLVDDWSQFVAVYPTSNSERLSKVRDVAQGRAFWAAEQVEDEAAAVEIALSKLRRQQAPTEAPRQRAAEG